jgi:hypothetical protein
MQWNQNRVQPTGSIQPGNFLSICKLLKELDLYTWKLYCQLAFSTIFRAELAEQIPEWKQVEELRSSEMSVDFQRITQRYIPEESTLM